MHTFATYIEVRHELELETERLLEAAGKKSQNTIVIVHGKSTT